MVSVLQANLIGCRVGFVLSCFFKSKFSCSLLWRERYSRPFHWALTSSINTRVVDRTAIERNRRVKSVGSWKSVVGNRKSEVGSQKSEIRSSHFVKSEVWSLMYEVLNLKSEVGSRKSEVWSWKSEVRRRKTPLGFRNLRSGSIFVSLCNNNPAGKAKRNLAVAVRKNVREPLKLGLISWGYDLPFPWFFPRPLLPRVTDWAHADMWSTSVIPLWNTWHQHSKR